MKSFIIFLMKNLNEMGIQIPEILLPKNLDVSTWAVVACDQYTQDREYWHSVEKIAGTKPSSLNLILPEVYLNDADKALRIEKIREQMGAYLNDGVFANAEVPIPKTNAATATVVNTDFFMCYSLPAFCVLTLRA